MAYNFITDPSGYMDSQEFADVIVGICGDETIVFDVGKNMEASMADVNTFRIMDGIAVSGNQIIGITAGTSVDFTIPAGTEGATNTYYVGFSLTNNGSTSMTQIVHRTMVNTESRLRDGETIQNVYLYKVIQKGYVVDSITPLYSFNGVKKTDSDETIVNFTDSKDTTQFKTWPLKLSKKNGYVYAHYVGIHNMRANQKVSFTGTIPNAYRPAEDIGISVTTISNNKPTGHARYTITSAGKCSYVSNVSGTQEIYISAVWPEKEE